MNIICRGFGNHTDYPNYPLIKMQISKYHHIIPAFYLSGFSSTGNRNGKLHVYNLLRHKRYVSKANNTGGQNNFFSINPNVAEADFIEKLMGEKIEHETSTFLYEVRKQRKMISPEHHRQLITLATLIYCRSEFSRFISTITMREKILSHLISGNISQQEWDTYRRERTWESGGTEYYTSNVFEAIQLARDKKLVPEAMKSGIVAQTLELMLPFYEKLIKRDWSMLIAEDNAGHFITSNLPLTGGEGWEPHRCHEGVLNPNATVVFPLDRRMALISWMREPWYHYRADKKLVSFVNSRTMMRSYGEIYWDGSNFPLMDANGVVSKFESYYQDLQKYPELRAKGIMTG